MAMGLMGWKSVSVFCILQAYRGMFGKNLTRKSGQHSASRSSLEGLWGFMVDDVGDEGEDDEEDALLSLFVILLMKSLQTLVAVVAISPLLVAARS